MIASAVDALKGAYRPNVFGSERRHFSEITSKNARVGKFRSLGHGRQQSEPVSDFSTVRRRRCYSWARQCSRAVVDLRASAQLGGGACMDRTGPYVAEPSRWHFSGLRGGISTLQSGTLSNYRDLLLVG